jgi:small subunit ribosomal protein S19
MTRSLWKGPFLDFFVKKLLQTSKKNEVSSSSKNLVNNLSVSNRVGIKKIWSRRSVIFPQFIDQNFEVHNGKQFIKLKVSEDMVGHKFGEFALTRKKPRHIGPKGRKKESSR